MGGLTSRTSNVPLCVILLIHITTQWFYRIYSRSEKLLSSLPSSLPFQLVLLVKRCQHYKSQPQLVSKAKLSLPLRSAAKNEHKLCEEAFNWRISYWFNAIFYSSNLKHLSKYYNFYSWRWVRSFYSWNILLYQHPFLFYFSLIFYYRSYFI